MEESPVIEINCPFCKALFKRTVEREKKRPLQFCAYCGTQFHQKSLPLHLDTKAALLVEHIPKNEEVQGKLGKYLLLQTIGKGGMGEVFLAFDTISGRKIALKRIRPDYVTTKNLRRRFIKEARITSQLTHPAIIPIYSIHIEQDVIYYTMPYVPGETLGTVLSKASEIEESARGNQKISIPYLLRIFLHVLQAVAYAHSKNVLHRDLKPENIIIGPYGQVTIFDWGLTKILGEQTEESENHEIKETQDVVVTRAEKPIGTVPYMAPEKALGKPASKQTDIYSLGVILYQILTLKLPFSRKNIKQFLENWKTEELTPPEIKAPYRDIPQALSIITQKCLAKEPEERYETCDELIAHIENFLEGKSEWFQTKHLDLSLKEDWEFQENILLSEHVAIVRSSDLSNWYSVCVSKAAFSENVRIDLFITLGETSKGIGLIVGAQGKTNRDHITDGYWLWITSSTNSLRKTTLLRSSAAVLETTEISLAVQKKHHIRLEKIDQTVTLFINGSLQFSFESHIPVVGPHVGLFVQDADMKIDSMDISTSSLSILVNCLAVPDAFLSYRAYDQALSEYRRIGESFFGRVEGREAIFRAGITLLEQAKHTPDISLQQKLFESSLHEFEKLHETPGAPLECLGKALVYQTMGDLAEEVKCYELAFRRYTNHPLLQVLVEHVIVRMNEGSLHNRVAAYQFVELVLQYIPSEYTKPMYQKLFYNLKLNWEHIPFFIQVPYSPDISLNRLRMCLSLAFWLKKTHVAFDVFQSLIDIPILPIEDLTNCCLLSTFCNNASTTVRFIEVWEKLLSSDEKEKHRHLFSCLLLPTSESLEHIKNTLTEATPGPLEATMLLLLMNRSCQSFHYDLLLELYAFKKRQIWFLDLEEQLDAFALEGFLQLEKYTEAKEILDSYPIERLQNQNCPLFFMYGCYIAATSSLQKALEHFDRISDTPYPRSFELAAHLIMGKISVNPLKWIQRSFPYEQNILLRHLLLYSKITKDLSYEPFITLLKRQDPL